MLGNMIMMGMPRVCKAVIKAKGGYSEEPTNIFRFYWILHDSMCYFIVLMSSLSFYNIWNYVVTKKVLNKSKYVLYLRFFKLATLCLDDSFAHSLVVLSTSFIR